MTKVLVVDDREDVRTALEVLLDLHGFEVLLAASPEQAIARVQQGGVELVVSDMNFTRDTTSGEEGAQLFRALRRLDPELPVVLITAWTSLETAIALVKEGAADYLAKPWDDERLVATIRAHVAMRAALPARGEDLSSTAAAREALAARHDLCGLVYASQQMHELVLLALKVAASNAPVLITGPNGSGKEKLAEIVQANSRRRTAPFVRVNAGALPDTLLEAELFGAEAGAFTGATKARVGRFEAASGGTLFLDEIGNLPLAGQMKLLRALQSGEITRLGSNQTRKVDVRVLSATNEDLPRAIAERTFREDLFFRLNVVEIAVPPLGERPDDILPLAVSFLARESGDTPRELSPRAREALLAHPFPGNVRELANRIARACLVATGPAIEPGDLGLTATRTSVVSPPPSSGPLRETASAPVDEAERAALEELFVREGGNVSRVAAALGLSRQALYRRMDRLGVVIERRPRGGE